MTTTTPTSAYFFGYGSLVNRNTHAYLDARPAKLRGWRRLWRHTDLRPVAFLTVEPASDVEIVGLMASVPDEAWTALDERERAYDRIEVSHHVDHGLKAKPDVVVYSIAPHKHKRPTAATPVLLSYIDVVAQGYAREFGETGLRDFFLTTSGWDVPIQNDRHQPIYPRHQQLTDYELGLVDEMLSEVRADVM